jgi:hypothetical protein
MHFLATLKSLKIYVFTYGVVKNVLYAFAHSSRPPESCPEKLFFSPLEWLKTCFDAFPHHQIQVLKKLFFEVWSGEKRVLMHFQTSRIKSF